MYVKPTKLMSAENWDKLLQKHNDECVRRYLAAKSASIKRKINGDQQKESLDNHDKPD